MPKSELDNFLSEANGGDENVTDEQKGEEFLSDNSDPLLDSPEPNKGTKEDEGANDEDDKKADKSVPFNKDPKIQRFIQKEIEKGLKNVPRQAPAPADNAGDEKVKELVDALVEIVGNDTPQKVSAVNRLVTQITRAEDRGAEKAMAKIKEIEEAEREKENVARAELQDAFESIEEQFDIDLSSNTKAAQKERNDFVDFIRRVSPKDEQGDVTQFPDLIETFKLFQTTRKPADNKRAKDLASRGMQRSSDASTTPKTGTTWKDIDRMFSKING